MSSDSGDTIAVPKGMLVGLATLAAAAVLGIVFMLGRASAPASKDKTPDPTPIAQVQFAPAPDDDASGSAPPGEEPRAKQSVRPSPEPRAKPESARPTPEPPHDPEPAVRPRPSTPSRPAVDPKQRAQVAQYFARMDSILQPARDWDRADSVTQAAVAQSMHADARQIKAILEANRNALVQVQAVKPPAPCQLHHQLAQRVLRDAVQLIGNLAAATLTGNMQDLGQDMAPMARSLRDQVARMREIRADLCSQYGIPLPRDPDAF
jgi:hypothetical protein